MTPEKKAEQIKRHFQIQMSLSSQTLIKYAARAYIGQLMEDFNLKPYDYTLAYKNEWHEYTSYWYAVLNAI